MAEKFDIANIKSYWMVEADEALIVANHLFEKKDYSYALFFGHLAVEKILKPDIPTLKCLFEKNAPKNLQPNKWISLRKYLNG